MKPTLALIAGSGALPRLIADAARGQGYEVTVLIFDAGLASGFDGFNPRYFSFGQVGAVMDVLKAGGIQHLVMAGKIHRPDFTKLKLDATGLMALPGIVAAATKGDDALIAAIVRLFESRGINVLAPETILAGLVPDQGVLTKTQPSVRDSADCAKGLHVARTMGALDIGQGAVIADGLVLAVEAAEGTDAMLGRIMHLPADIRGTPDKRRGVLVKCAKPGQERRVDLPAIGPDTVHAASRAGLAGIAVEAQASLIIDRAGVIGAADAAGLFVTAIAGDM
jgi:DUF1009 family protein